MRMSGRHARDDGCERSGIAALEDFEENGVEPLEDGICVASSNQFSKAISSDWSE